AVSCRTSWRRGSPWTAMHSASSAEFALFRSVLVMISPQISMQPPAALMTAWVMLTARGFSRPARSFQNPGVRQISATHCWWVWTQLPPSQPAVVQALLSVSVQGVLSGLLACVATQTPCVLSVGLSSQPAALQSTGFVAVQGVLAVTGMQLAVAGSQLPVLHWSFGQVFWLCVCTHAPASQPAVVHLLLSVSEHGVLSVTLSCVCEQALWSASAGSISQPAVLQSFGVVSVHGVLAVTGTQAPLEGLHVPVLH